MPSIRIETGTWLRGREHDLMLAVSEATFEPLGVRPEDNDVVINCRDAETRLIAPGKSDRFCRIEIKMLVGRSDDHKRSLRANICQSLAPFGIPDSDVKIIVTDVPRTNLGYQDLSMVYSSTCQEVTVPAFICAACGISHAPSERPPEHCTICEEERQWVPESGQSWTTPEGLAARHLNAFREYEPGLIGIGSKPHFGIGQRALLVCTPHGNVLWDCISLLDAATVTLIKGLGGLKAIGISHPHFYSTMGDWSRAFGDVPIYLHAADREWIMRSESAVEFWDGETLQLMPDVTLIRGGGHFPGAAMLHWAKAAEGRGAVLTSDTATISQDRKFFSFMRGYPTLIPLSAREVEAIGSALAPFQFDAAYGQFFDRAIPIGAKRILEISVRRYLAAIAGTARPQGD